MENRLIEDDGLRWINQIHRDDLVALVASLIDATPELGAVYEVRPMIRYDAHRYYA